MEHFGPSWSALQILFTSNQVGNRVLHEVHHNQVQVVETSPLLTKYTCTVVHVSSSCKTSVLLQMTVGLISWR